MPFHRTIWASAFAVAQLSLSLVSAAIQNPCQIVANQQLLSLDGQYLERESDILYKGTFDAKTAYECITTVPLYTDEAAQMVDYIKTYWSMLSTLAYLKDPPKSYQQPAVDIMARLDEVSSNLDDGAYNNQYEFDLDIMSILADSHEGHLQLEIGTMYLFRFILPENIVSISSDGQEIPQIYAYSDVKNNIDDASPIIELGGESVFTYLRKSLKTRVLGTIEPHADFKNLMLSSAASFATTGGGTSFSVSLNGLALGSTYNGQSLKGRFANGTDFDWKYVAGTTANLTDWEYFDGASIYRGYIQRKANAEARGLGTTRRPKDRGADATVAQRDITSVPYVGYPTDPVVVQANFSSGGTVSGYLLEDDSIGVLSVPTFSTSESGSAAGFGEAVDDFIQKAKKAGMKKIVIDVQGNTGGTLFVGYDLVKRFFPNVEPKQELYRGRQLAPYRTYGSFISGVIAEGGDAGISEPQIDVATSTYGNNVLLNINGYGVQPNQTAWGSYNDFFNGEKIHGDQFTQATTFNLTSPLIHPPISGYGQNLSYDEPPWAAEDVVFLTDGICASTCHTVQMLLKNDVGVKTVVVGGIPEYGPMQGVAGTRGGSLETWSFYSGLTELLQEVEEEASSNKTWADFLEKLDITEDSFKGLFPVIEDMPWQANPSTNTLNIVRPESEDVVRQFVYEAAECRLFYTGEMYRDVTQLWRAAGKFVNGDDSVCVPGSVDAPGSKTNNTLMESPGFTYDDTWANANSTDVPDYSQSKSSGGDDSDSSSKGGSDSSGDHKGSASATFKSTSSVLFALMFSAFVLL